jgi:lipopolysaccharide transport system ATP-binding protein
MATESDFSSLRGDWSIRVDGMGKRYTLGEREQYHALRDVIARGGRRLIGQEREPVPATERWALDDVTLRIAPGEVVGIVGRNGAGKSTLLKLISRITRPTRGEVAVRGRVGTLLEVGSGFHPELTGAENIYLNGAILGMRRAEIKANFDRIVEFSGVAPFLATPVKRYSTGMYMRLAFAVAAHLDTEVLLVDEVLAVGDADYQRKCVGRMRELSQNEGRTVLLVSHNDAAIRQLCPRSIWLRDGSVHMDGPSDDVVPAYLEDQYRKAVLGEWLDLAGREHAGSGEVRFRHVRLGVPGKPLAKTLAPGDPLAITCLVEASEPVDCGAITAYFSTANGLKVISTGSDPHGSPVHVPAGTHEVTIAVDAVHLNPGHYVGSLWMARPTGARRKFALYDFVEDAVDLVVAPSDARDTPEGLVATQSSLTINAAEVGVR